MRLLILLSLLAMASAATRFTRATGDWGSSLVWLGAEVPTASDDVVVSHSVTISTGSVSILFANITSAGRITVNADASLSLDSAVVQGGIQGAGAVSIANQLTLSDSVSAANVRLQGTASTLTLSGAVSNPAHRLLEAIQVILSGSASRNIDGSVQTNRAGSLSFSDSTIAIATTSGVRLGGRVNLGATAVSVSGDVTFIGSELSGSGGSVQSSGAFLFTPGSSTFNIAGTAVTVAAGANQRVTVTTNSISVVSGCTFTVDSDFLATGSFESNNGVASVNSLTLGATGAVSFVGTNAVLTVRGNLYNPSNRGFDVNLLVLPGTESGARAVSGAIQTRSGRTQISVDQTLTASDNSVVLGGVLDLSGKTLNLVGGNFTLQGQGVVNGGKVVCAEWLLLSASSSAYSVQSAQLELEVGDSSFIHIVSNKRFDLGSNQVTFNRLLVTGQLYSTAGGQAIIQHLWIAAAGSVTLSGTGSSVTVTGDISNAATASNGFQAESVVLGGTANSLKMVTGQVQTLKTGALIVTCDQTLQQAAGGAPIRLGGVLQLNGFELALVSPSGEDVVLNGNGITTSGGSVVSQSGDLLVDPASTAYAVSGEVNLIAAQGARVRVVASRRLSSMDNSKITVVPQLFLEGATLDGDGRVVVQDLVLGLSASNNRAQVKMGGGLDVTGDIDNSIGSATFYASPLRLLGAFSRTIRGAIQTNSGNDVVVGCSTTLTAQSSAIIGGRLYLNGQTLGVNSDLVITASQVFGPGLVRFDDGCGCSPPNVNFAQASSLTISGTPIFQNVIVNLNRTTTLPNSNTVFEVAGARSKLSVNVRVAGAGNIKAYLLELNAPSGRLSLNAASFIETDLPVVNRAGFTIVGVVRSPPVEASALCVDDVCMRMSVRDLRRQVTALSTALRNTASFANCESGTCPGWNADYTTLSCPQPLLS